MTTTTETPGNITIEEISKGIATLGVIRSAIAFVCRPDIAQRLRDMLDQSNVPDLGLFGCPNLGIEVFSDSEQTEPCLAFHDREQLRVYLARNRRCASNNCATVGARWWCDVDKIFYCDACAERISMTQPEFPGFEAYRLVRI